MQHLPDFKVCSNVVRRLLTVVNSQVTDCPEDWICRLAFALVLDADPQA
jgi:hypothetical protein